MSSRDARSLQCVEDFESRFPAEEDQERILTLVRDHLAEPAAATTASHRAQRHAAAMDVDVEEEEHYDGSDDEFVHEGLQGAGGQPDKELDEVGET